MKLGLDVARIAALERLLPELPPPMLRSAAADVHVLDVQNRLLRRFTRRSAPGLEWLATRVTSDSVGRLRAITGPVILVSWHLGPTLAIAAGLLRSETPALVVRHARGLPRARWQPRGRLDRVEREECCNSAQASSRSFAGWRGRRAGPRRSRNGNVAGEVPRAPDPLSARGVHAGAHDGRSPGPRGRSLDGHEPEPVRGRLARSAPVDAGTRGEQRR